MKKIIAVIIITHALFIYGCGQVFTAHSQRKQAQADFMQTFYENNLKREKAGLKPLDFCSEAYKFYPAFAKQKVECKERILRYESGDESALEI